MQGEPGWKDVLENWQIRTVVLPPGSTLANLLKQIPRQWETVYQDKEAVIMKRQSEGDL
jgi:hypothetical protein